MKQLLLFTLCFFLCATGLFAQPSITINTFDDEPIYCSWDEGCTRRAVSNTFNFSAIENYTYKEVLMHVTLACPDNGCDPWDRYADIDLLVPTGQMDSTIAVIDTVLNGSGDIVSIDTTWNEPFEVTEAFEIFRYITPYGGGFNASTWNHTWTLDVSDYRMFLEDEVMLRAYIDTWVDPAWTITVDFEFIGGEPDRIAYKMINLWNYGSVPYGDTDVNVEEQYLPAINFTADAEAHYAKVKIMNTGHGFGFTDNAAEFSPKTHRIIATSAVNSETYDQFLWRDDCEFNDVAPQAGTWQYDRAGWCPGDKVATWDYDISHLLTPNQEMSVDYNLEYYVNTCNSNNPDCVASVDCAGGSCSEDANPYYIISSQLVYYRAIPQYDLDAEVVSLSNVENIMCTNTFSPQLRLRNNGAAAITSLSIAMQLDDESFTFYDWSGNLAHGEFSTINLPEITLNDTEQHELSVSFLMVNNATDGNFENDYINTSFYFGNNSISLHLITDNWGSETSFDITNSNGDVMIAGNGYAGLSNYINNYCLPNGCYSFNFYDSYGDGVSGSAPENAGTYTLTDAYGNELASLQNADFGTVETTEFCIDTNIGIAELPLEMQLQAHPNPVVRGQALQLQLPNYMWQSGQAFTCNLINLQGKNVYTQHLPATQQAAHAIQLPNNATTGVYLLQVQSATYQQSIKVLIR